VSSCYRLVLWGHLRASDLVIVHSYLFRLWIFMMMLMVAVYCYLISMFWRMLLTSFSLSVQDTWQILDVDGINRRPWTLDWVREWIVLVWLFHLCIGDIWSIILWCFSWIIDSVLLMDAGWWFLANQTCIRSKGVAGEVWQQPCNILLSLSLWLEL